MIDPSRRWGELGLDRDSTGDQHIARVQIISQRRPRGRIGEPPEVNHERYFSVHATGVRSLFVFFAVRLARGGPWDWSRELREQDGWDEHARFMDALVDDGFVVLGGPLAGEREILHAIAAPSEEAVRQRLAQDNWHQNGMLTIESIEPWTILLDGRRV